VLKKKEALKMNQLVLIQSWELKLVCTI